jgi:glycosyltransferase involved in cell wall biosynthesis
MTSVVIAAHNEATVIGRCLDALLADALPGELEVIVSANGCTDDTAEVARSRPGVVVVESPEPGKAAALNRADAVASEYPRIYLDADIPVATATIRALRDVLTEDERHLVATPSRRLDVSGRPWAVRAFFAVQGRLPVYQDGLFGRGLIALSETGRHRFGSFPEVVADDLFLDSLFSADERVRLSDTFTEVATPLRTGDLVRRLVRVRRGNASLRADVRIPDAAVVRGSDKTAWLREVVLPRPWLAPAAVVYVTITAYAAWRARRGSSDDLTWGRDDSTRGVPEHQVAR